MLNFLKSRFYSFVDDNIQRTSLLVFIVIFIVSLLNFFKTPSLEWSLRVILYGIGIMSTFFAGNRGTWISWFLIASTFIYFSTYQNISYFIVITLLAVFYPKMWACLNIIYAIQVFIICHCHNTPIKNVLYHAALCCGIYFTTKVLVTRIQRIKDSKSEKLNLTSDERIILEYLCQGICQNDIPEFAPVTVSRKLRQAKVRNGVSSTTKLKEIYIEEKELSDS